MIDGITEFVFMFFYNLDWGSELDKALTQQDQPCSDESRKWVMNKSDSLALLLCVLENTVRLFLRKEMGEALGYLKCMSCQEPFVGVQVLLVP